MIHISIDTSKPMFKGDLETAVVATLVKIACNIKENGLKDTLFNDTDTGDVIARVTHTPRMKK